MMDSSEEQMDLQKLGGILTRLLQDNSPNLDCHPAGYDKGYAEGYHDALVDVMKQAGIETSEEYYN